MDGTSPLRAAVLFVALTLILAAAPVGAATSPATRHQTALDPLETDNTVTRIEVSSNGSARWTVMIRTRLATDDELDEYRAFQTQFRANTSRYAAQFRTRITGVVGAAANTTGREMHVEAIDAEVHIQEVPRRWGVVSYSFTWTGFAAQTDGTLVVGDVFDGGFFLAENDRLVIEAPTGFSTLDASPSPASRESGAVTWIGREDFDDGRPRVAFAPAGRQSPSTRTGTPGSAATPTESALFSGSGAHEDLLLLAGGGMTLVLVALGGRSLARRRRRASGSPAVPTDGDHAAPITDAERVRDVLGGNEGRLRQADIAEQLGWSTSKTSRVLSTMEDSGDVEKLRIGRENLIQLRQPER